MKKFLVSSISILMLGMALAGCGHKETYINTEQNSYTANVKDEKKINFETNKGASYSVFQGSKKGKRIIGPNVAKTGSVDLSLVDTGKFTIKATNDKDTTYKTITVKPNSNRINLEVLNKDSEYTTDENGNFLIKGTINKDAPITVASDSLNNNGKNKITKKFKKGNFSIKIPLKFNTNSKQVELAIGVHDVKNNVWDSWTLNVANGTKQYKDLQVQKQKKMEAEKKAAKTSEVAAPDTVYYLNEEAIFGNYDTNDKSFGLKVTQANQNFDGHGQSLVNDNDIPSLSVDQSNGVQFTVNYTNYNLSTFVPTLQNFTVYDDDGEAGEIINQQEGQDEISEGHSADTHFWANFKKPFSQMKYIEVEYNDEDTNMTVKFKIDRS